MDLATRSKSFSCRPLGQLLPINLLFNSVSMTLYTGWLMSAPCSTNMRMTSVESMTPWSWSVFDGWPCTSTARCTAVRPSQAHTTNDDIHDEKLLLISHTPVSGLVIIATGKALARGCTDHFSSMFSVTLSYEHDLWDSIRLNQHATYLGQRSLVQKL